MLCQGERAILETTFRYPGDFMFHAHQSEFAELGWMGLFRAEAARRRHDASPSCWRSCRSLLLGALLVADRPVGPGRCDARRDFRRSNGSRFSEWSSSPAPSSSA